MKWMTGAQRILLKELYMVLKNQICICFLQMNLTMVPCRLGRISRWNWKMVCFILGLPPTERRSVTEIGFRKKRACIISMVFVWKRMRNTDTGL